MLVIGGASITMWRPPRESNGDDFDASDLRKAREEPHVNSRALTCSPTMRIITLNVNGLRSAERKGLARWLKRAEPWDVVCLQEIKCGEQDVPRSLRAPRRSHAAFGCAARKGYSGVALYSKRPAHFSSGFGHGEFDPEGRYLE
ncbi:MAG TPA: endonuclease/exonuclease/phosphatase family protein, partial [Candidatus Cybelea sp.]|nr:endonuclease/exonuclease/phosphatase family protein [Candidatus Cybelea sp.]